MAKNIIHVAAIMIVVPTDDILALGAYSYVIFCL